MRALFAFFVAACGLFVASCSTPTANEPKPEVTSWALAPDLESGLGYTLQKGMPQTLLTKLMGKPWRVGRVVDEGRVLQRWTYRRTIRGPLTAKTMTTQNGTYTVMQPARYVDHVDIDLFEEKISSVRITRKPDQITPGLLPAL